MTSFIVVPPNEKEDDVVNAFDAAIHDLAASGPTEAELQRIASRCARTGISNSKSQFPVLPFCRTRCCLTAMQIR